MPQEGAACASASIQRTARLPLDYAARMDLRKLTACVALLGAAATSACDKKDQDAKSDEASPKADAAASPADAASAKEHDDASPDVKEVPAAGTGHAAGAAKAEGSCAPGGCAPGACGGHAKEGDAPDAAQAKAGEAADEAPAKPEDGDQS